MAAGVYKHRTLIKMSLVVSALRYGGALGPRLGPAGCLEGRPGGGFGMPGKSTFMRMGVGPEKRVSEFRMDRRVTCI